MTFSELSHNEQVGLIGLMKAVAMANGVISAEEMRGIDKVADELGDEAYRSLLEEVGKRFSDLGKLKEFLAGVEDESARNLIYGTVWEESIADPDINHTETELLDWLRNTWQITERE